MEGQPSHEHAQRVQKIIRTLNQLHVTQTNCTRHFSPAYTRQSDALLSKVNRDIKHCTDEHMRASKQCTIDNSNLMTREQFLGFYDGLYGDAIQMQVSASDGGSSEQQD